MKDTKSKWFKSYKRTQFVNFDDCHSSMLPVTTVTIGVPQGSILDQLLFIMIFTEIVNISNQFPLQMIQF